MATLPFSTSHKYIIVIFLEILFIVAGIVLSIFAYQIAPFWAAIVALIFIGVIIATLTKFATKGIPELSWEDAIIALGGGQPKIVKIYDSKYGNLWFCEKGIMIGHQKGQTFFYGRGLQGFPYFLGHKKLVINCLTSEEMAGNIIEIDSPIQPFIFPDLLWIDTVNAITVKGVDSYQEYKRYGASVEMAKNQRLYNQIIMSQNPELAKKVGSGISLADLMQENY